MPVPPHAASAPMPEGYEFVHVLGGGGCGWVALARQHALDRLVAVKTLHAGTADPTERLRLEREGRALARVRDPRVVAVHEIAEVGDDLALVLEYVPGGDLQDALAEHRLDGTGVLTAFVDVAGALAAAAEAGVVHRDVKPANVLLTPEGRGKLGDFGIARLAAATGAFRTGGTTVIGTPRYLPPEQATDPEHESPAGDVYSFAVMVYEALLGRPPFTADSAPAMLFAHLHIPPPRPRSLRPSVSAEVDAVLQDALAKDPTARPPIAVVAEVLARHPEDWTHIRADTRKDDGPTADVPSEYIHADRAADETAAVRTAAVRWADTAPVVTPTVFRPSTASAPTARPPRRGAALVGLAVGVALVIVLVLLLG
ncbi:serine/threonine-protein kinase [Jatrophihabitans fulvus]